MATTAKQDTKDTKDKDVTKETKITNETTVVKSRGSKDEPIQEASKIDKKGRCSSRFEEALAEIFQESSYAGCRSYTNPWRR